MEKSEDDDVATKVASRVYTVESPKPDSTGVAAVSTAVSVGGSVSAAPPMSVNINALECECETVMSKASGPPDKEAYYHANCETTASITTGAASGPFSGCPAGGPSMVVPNTFVSHPEAERMLPSHATVVGVITVPVSSA